MPKMLYNGIKLPNINDVWVDKETYPDAVIGCNTTDGSLPYILKLLKYETSLMSSGVMYHPLSTNYKAYELSEDGLSWVESSESVPYNNCKWASYDVFNEDGTLYLAATDPLPVGTPITDPVSFTMGYQLGCRLRAQRAVKKPIGYLYGGVLLPELPEWDKSKYPYAFIRSVNSGTDYRELYVFKTPPTWFRPTTLVDAYGVEDGNAYLKAVDYPYGSDEDWGYVALSEKTSGGYLAKINFDSIFWANFDVLNKDGTVYLAGSEPVPVYERGDG